MALHTWIYITEVMLSPEGPRLYTPLGFSPNPGDLAPATLFGLTAGPRQNPDNRLAPFACPPGQTTRVHLHQLRAWNASIRNMPLTCIKNMILSLLAGGTLCVKFFRKLKVRAQRRRTWTSASAERLVSAVIVSVVMTDSWASL